VTGHIENQDLTTIEQRMENTKEFKSQAVIEVTAEGPIKVTGNILITDSKRDIADKSGEVLLCSCGRSANKPYCDDSHKK
jgi:hypothetical protein